MGGAQSRHAPGPIMAGKTVVVTGANSGIGFATCGHLAEAGATVILACRRRDAAEEAADLLRKAHPKATIRVGPPLDTQSLTSVRSFASALLQQLGKEPLHVRQLAPPLFLHCFGPAAKRPPQSRSSFIPPVFVFLSRCSLTMPAATCGRGPPRPSRRKAWECWPRCRANFRAALSVDSSLVCEPSPLADRLTRAR